MNINELTNDLKKYTITEVLQKHQLTWKELIRIQSDRYPYRETDTNREIPKYIRKNTIGNYYIVKSINGKEEYYGTYPSIYEAQIITDELIQHNWNKNILPLIIKKHNIRTITY